MKGKSILIVDDENLIRLSLKVDLEREGFRTTAAENTAAALRALSDSQYDLILTDYLMEGDDGVALMQQAKKLYPGIRVIIFSGFEEENSRAKFKEFGADDFITKPIDFEELLARITDILAG